MHATKKLIELHCKKRLNDHIWSTLYVTSQIALRRRLRCLALLKLPTDNWEKKSSNNKQHEAKDIPKEIFSYATTVEKVENGYSIFQFLG